MSNKPNIDSWEKAWEVAEQENQKLSEEMWKYKVRAERAVIVIEEMLRLDSDCLDNNCCVCSWCVGRKFIQEAKG